MPIIVYNQPDGGLWMKVQKYLPEYVCHGRIGRPWLLATKAEKPLTLTELYANDNS